MSQRIVRTTNRHASHTCSPVPTKCQANQSSHSTNSTHLEKTSFGRKGVDSAIVFRSGQIHGSIVIIYLGYNRKGEGLRKDQGQHQKQWTSLSWRFAATHRDKRRPRSQEGSRSSTNEGSFGRRADQTSKLSWSVLRPTINPPAHHMPSSDDNSK